MLEAAAFLGVLAEADVEWMVANSTQQEIEAGAVLIQRAVPVEYLYLIVDGAFEVWVNAPEERHVATLYAGELVGEMSFVDMHPPSATVIAGMESRVLEIARTDMTRKIEADTGFGQRFFKGVSVLLAGRLRNAYKVDPRVPGGLDMVEMHLLEERYEHIRRRLKLV